MKRLLLVSAVFCLINIPGTTGTPFFYPDPDPDCYQPTEPPYNGYGYQGPSYQETVQEILRALQEIVYLTVQAAKEEVRQLARIWLPPCDTTIYPGSDETQDDAPDGVWSQPQPIDDPSEASPILDNKLDNQITSIDITNGTKKILTIQNTTVTTHHPDENSSTLKDILNNTTSPSDMEETTSEYVTEETTTEMFTNETKE